MVTSPPMWLPAADARIGATGAPSRFPEINFSSASGGVAAEICELKTIYGVEHIWFGDDIFALDRHWVQQFADAIECTVNCVALQDPVACRSHERGDRREL